MKWTRCLTGRAILLLVSGSLLFSCALNWFIVPAGLFNGGFLGIAQLLQHLLRSVFRLRRIYEPLRQACCKGR